jgi:hypothetical protein
MHTVKYRYFALFRLKGVVYRNETEDQVLFDDHSALIRVSFITANTEALYDVDRKFAALALTYRDKLSSESEDPQFSELLRKEIQDVRAQRSTEKSNEARLLITKDSSTYDFNTQFTKDCGQFEVCNDAVSPDSINLKHRDEIERILTAFVCGSQQVLGIKCLFETVVFYPNDNKPTYSFSSQFGDVDGYISQLLDTVEVGKIVNCFESMRTDSTLSRVRHLLRTSFESEPDKLRSFLSAWSALEIFIGKMFAKCEDEIFDALRQSKQISPMLEFVRNVRTAMESRYRFMDRFSAVAMTFDPENADSDIKAVKGFKSTRDGLAHGEDIVDRDLPCSSVRNIVRKYLQLCFANPLRPSDPTGQIN